jgi:hypothetical protein
MSSITRNLFEVGQNRGLFGNGNVRARRVREGDERDAAREHMCNAIHSALMDKDHDRAKQLHEALMECDEGDEDLNDESQSGRGDPLKKYGTRNDAASGKGKESMESIERWTRRLLRPDIVHLR